METLLKMTVAYAFGWIWNDIARNFIKRIK